MFSRRPCQLMLHSQEMDPFRMLISSPRDTSSSPASPCRSLSSLPSAMETCNQEDSCMQPDTPDGQDVSRFHPLSSSFVSDIEAWRPAGLRHVKAPHVDALRVESSWVAGGVPWPQSEELQLSGAFQDGTDSGDADMTSTSGRPIEQAMESHLSSASLTAVLDGASPAEAQQSIEREKLDSWRPLGLSPVKAPRPAVAPPVVEILCKQPISARPELPPALVESIASFRPAGLAPIRVQATGDDSCTDSGSSAGCSPQAPHATDRAPDSAFEMPADAASWRPAGLKPIRIRRAAIDETENTPTAPKAAGAGARCAFPPCETDSPRAPPQAGELDDSLSPTVIPDPAAWRPAGLSPLRLSSPMDECKSPSPRLNLSPRPQVSPLPSPRTGSPRPRPRDILRLERDLGPLSSLVAEGKTSAASSGRSSPSTPRFKSMAPRKGLTIQSRLRKDDVDSNADSENTPPGSVTPSVTPGASTPGSAAPSPLAPSNRQRMGQASRGWEKEAKKSGAAESTGKEELSNTMQLLSVLPCLAMLDRPSLQDVAAAAELQRFGAGEAVVWQGAPVENLLVVLRGSLAAWQEGAADPLFHLKEGTACPHRLGAASPQGWCASIVAGEQGAACLLIPLQAVQKRAKTCSVLDN